MLTSFCAAQRLHMTRSAVSQQMSVLDTSGEALSLLADGEVDAVLISDYDFEPLPADGRFARQHLADDPMMVVLPADLASDQWITRAHRPVYGAESYEKMFRHRRL
jgi:DNA-binding transcriptional LysR family regulator